MGKSYWSHPQERYGGLIRNMGKVIELAGSLDHPHAYRDRALMLTVLTTGGRMSEVLELTWEDAAGDYVHYDRHRWLRKVPISPVLRKALDVLYVVEGGPPLSERIFRIGPRTVHAVFKRVRVELGIANLSPHDLRYLFAVGLAKRKMPLGTIARLLGHRDAHMTASYLGEFSTIN